MAVRRAVQRLPSEHCGELIEGSREHRQLRFLWSIDRRDGSDVLPQSVERVGRMTSPGDLPFALLEQVLDRGAAQVVEHATRHEHGVGQFRRHVAQRQWRFAEAIELLAKSVDRGRMLAGQLQRSRPSLRDVRPSANLDTSTSGSPALPETWNSTGSRRTG